MTQGSLIVGAYLGLGTLFAFGAESETITIRQLRGFAEYDCDVGCPVDVIDVVCSDGITFQHECYALCQGMPLIERGPCDDGSDFGFLLGSASSERSLMRENLNSGANQYNRTTISQMNRYSEENFLFIGHVSFDEDSRPPSVDPVADSPLDGDGFPVASGQQDSGEAVRAVRVAFDGLGYMSTQLYPDNEGGHKKTTGKQRDKAAKKGRSRHHTPKAMTAKKGKEESKSAKEKKGKEGSKSAKAKKGKEGKNVIYYANGEGLLAGGNRFDTDGDDEFDLIPESIIGTDTRFEVDDTRTNPYKQIVEFDYGSGEGGCTGIIVGRNSIMTAAHCVYNRGKRKWHPLRKGAPGRYESGGRSREPYGEWEAEDATIYGKWATEGSITHDVAVVRMKKNRRYGRIGDRMGVVSLGNNNCDVPSSSQVTGYPADKPNGAMYTSGRCDAWRHNCNDLRVYHKCDTKGGNSGSPLLDPSGRTFGVHTHGGSQWNSGVMFTDEHLRVLRNWIK